MRTIHEGSIAELGSENWTEPNDVIAPIPELAAQKVIEANAEADETLLDRDLRIRVREIDIDGNPLTSWSYFTGKARKTFRSNVNPEQ